MFEISFVKEGPGRKPHGYEKEQLDGADPADVKRGPNASPNIQILVYSKGRYISEGRKKCQPSCVKEFNKSNASYNSMTYPPTSVLHAAASTPLSTRLFPIRPLASSSRWVGNEVRSKSADSEVRCISCNKISFCAGTVLIVSSYALARISCARRHNSETASPWETRLLRETDSTIFGSHGQHKTTVEATSPLRYHSFDFRVRAGALLQQYSRGEANNTDTMCVASVIT